MRALTAAAMMPATDATAPLLVEAMQDRYPIVRYFAANALAAQYPALPKPDYLAPAETRDATLRSWLPPGRRKHCALPANARVTTERRAAPRLTLKLANKLAFRTLSSFCLPNALDLLRRPPR